MSESYIISKDISRMIIPQVIKTGLLCLIFFVAIKVNIFLFIKYRLLGTRPHTIVDLLIAAIIFLLFAIQVIITYIKTIKCRYVFYDDRIEHNKWVVHYNEIQAPSVTQDRLDKIFKTGSVMLVQGKVMEHIKHSAEMVQYVQRLVGMQGYYDQYYQQNQR